MVWLFINSVNVELKQWLYKNGDQCAWNTGGWVRCKVTSQKNSVSGKWYDTPTTSIGKATSSLTFTNNSIQYICSASTSDVITISNNIVVRAGASSYVNFGTLNQIQYKKYKKLKTAMTGSPLSCSFRVGSANTVNTDVNTATIIRKALTSVQDISVESESGYIVIGAAIAIPNKSNSGTPVPEDSKNYSGSYTEIWLE